MKDLTIRIDDIEYTLPAQAQATPAHRNPNQCVPRITFQGGRDVNLIGYPFFENYGVSYDYPNGQIEFGVNNLAYSGTEIKNLAPAPTPTPTPEPTPTPTPTPTPVPVDPSEDG